MSESVHLPVALVGGAVLPDRLSQTEWAAETRRLLEADRRLRWVIGAWLERGCARFGLSYQQAADAIGCDKSTIANYIHVVRAFPGDVETQRYDLDWTHYLTVCDLPSAEADQLLELAQARSLSTRELEREVRRRYPLPKAAPRQSQTHRGSVTISGNDAELIAEAIELTAMQLEDWLEEHDTDAKVTITTPTKP